MSLKGKTLFITGGSRGIGLAIALKAAADGANIAIAAKTVDPHPKLEGTIHTAAAEIEKAGGRALPLAVDVREEAAVKAAIEQTAEKFGGLDIVVNNASAIQLTQVAATDMRRYDLMQQINARGTFMVSKYALPHLAKAANPHILMLSPPLDMQTKWFAPHTAYSIAKFGMSLVVLGLAGEQRGKIAVNALWPRTTIATAAIKNLLGGDTIMRMSRKPEILAEAAYRIFHKPKTFTGNFLIDDTFLSSEGVSDFDPYRVDPSQPLQVDFFVPDTSPPPDGVSLGPLKAKEERDDKTDSIGKRMRLIRLAYGKLNGHPNGMSQTEMARLCGMSAQAWNNSETGDNRISIDNARSLQDRTGASLDYIYTGNIASLPHRLAIEIQKLE